MYHYMEFDPYLIRERNQQVHRDVDSLRLEKRLRKDRGSSGRRFVALAKRGMRPLLRAAPHRDTDAVVRDLKRHKGEGGVNGL